MKKIALLVGLCSLSAPALADWQFTRWGMSVDEVIAASNGSASAVEYDEGNDVFDYHRLAAGTSQLDGQSFDVEYYFTPTTKKLAMVRYPDLEKKGCDTVEQMFIKLNGKGKVKKENALKNVPNVALISTMRKWTAKNSDKMSFNRLYSKTFFSEEENCLFVVESATNRSRK